MSIMKDQLIQKLTDRRHRLGVTQHHLAALSGVSEIAIKKIESGKSKPTISTLEKLADVLGMEIKIEIRKVQI